MSRRTALIAAVLAVGIAIALPGAGARPRVTAAADSTRQSQAIAFFEARLARDSHDYLAAGQLVPRYLSRFRTAADLADLGRAAEAARAVLALTPDSATALARLGTTALARHEFAPAYRLAREALGVDASHEEALGLLFDAALATGRYVVAESTLRRLEPGRPSQQVRLAQWLNAQGNAAGAAFALHGLCRRMARSPHRAVTLAWCWVELGKIEGGLRGAPAAAARFRRALAVLPGYRGAIEGLADLAHARGDWRAARRLYARIATDAHPDVYLRLAEAHRCLGDRVGARRYEARFVSIAAAPDAEALYGRELALFFTEHHATRPLAVAIARRDLERRPAVESWDVLSWALFRLGNLEGALAAAREARRWGAPAPTMDYHLASILDSLGRPSDATALRGAARTADPSTLAPHVRLANDTLSCAER